MKTFYWFLIIILMVLVSQCDAWEYTPETNIKQDNTKVLTIDAGKDGVIEILLYRGVMHTAKHTTVWNGNEVITILAPNKSVRMINQRVVREMSK